MKLLIVTQVIDTEHPILGFFHRWVEEFARHAEQVHVIALEAGKHSLPAHVTVHSLGKEVGTGKLTQLWRLWRYSWQLRNEYDNVFVHMIPLYVMLGGPLWRLFGKSIGFWYAHGAVSWQLRVAVWLSHVVFTSTNEGLRIETKKKVIVGQGIDTNRFASGHKQPTAELKLITVGRISSSKNLTTLVRAASELLKKGIIFSLQIIGSPSTDKDVRYKQQLRTLVTELRLADSIEWVGPVPQSELPAYLQQADIFIHDGATNSLDKTLLEAALCGTVVISSNPAFINVAKDFTPELLFAPKDHQALSTLIESVSKQPEAVAPGVTALREHVKQQYSVSNLISGIVQRM